jgi:hypothetical protein
MRTEFRPLSIVLAITVLLACLCATFIPTRSGDQHARGKWADAASILTMELGAELQTMLSRPVHTGARNKARNIDKQ